MEMMLAMKILLINLSSSNFGKSNVRCGKSQELGNISFDSEREKIIESLTIDFQKSLKKNIK
jgi:hypothetical protein